jgi:hypothetical protein
MRLRSTALPICRVTVKPNRGPSAARVLPSRALASRTKAAAAHRLPLRTRRYSERLLRVVTREAEPLACVALAMRHPSLPTATSRREALATLRAPPCHDPPTARGRHALAETMPALAHELARLVGPFHVKSPFRVKARVSGPCSSGPCSSGPCSSDPCSSDPSSSDPSSSDPSSSDPSSSGSSVWLRATLLKPDLARTRLAQGRARVGKNALLAVIIALPGDAGHTPVADASRRAYRIGARPSQFGGKSPVQFGETHQIFSLSLTCA